MKGHILEESYHIGLISYELTSIIPDCSKINWVNERRFGRDGWFADPFILRETEESIILFAEQLYKKTGLGRLVQIEVEKQNFSIVDVAPILELDTHLSFPAIWKEEGHCYVYPENYQSGKLQIWQYDEHSRKLVNPVTLVEEPLLDSQLLKLDDKYYIFATKFIEGNLTDTKKLFIYRSNSLLGKYEIIQEICNSKNEERGAGSIFYNNGQIIRPVQNCNNTYGESLILKELIYENGIFEQKEICRILPEKKHIYGHALHTFNTFNNLVVVDGQGYDYSFWANLYIGLHRLKVALASSKIL